jgi:hypothetical protein
MEWKFWQKLAGAKGVVGLNARLSKIKDLPTHIGMHLVVKEKLDPDWVWSLKIVNRPSAEDKKIYDFRIFSDKQAADAGVRVADYDSLTVHPELILYLGYSNKSGSVFNIDQGDSLKAA